jgi:hypothetical protein
VGGYTHPSEVAARGALAFEVTAANHNFPEGVRLRAYDFRERVLRG